MCVRKYFWSKKKHDWSKWVYTNKSYLVDGGYITSHIKYGNRKCLICGEEQSDIKY